MGGKTNASLRRLNERPNAMELHKRYDAQAPLMDEFEKVWGFHAATRRFDLPESTLTRILERYRKRIGEVADDPLVKIDRFALHEDGVSLFEKLATAFINKISKKEAENAELRAENDSLKQQIAALQHEKKTWAVDQAGREERVLLELMKKLEANGS